MTATRRAACSCGQLTVTTQGEPARNSVCHCLNCKRRTGTAFSWNATFEETQVEVAGEHASYTRSSEEGFWARHHFCSVCGTRVFSRSSGGRTWFRSWPGCSWILPSSPTVEVYGERRCTWLPEVAASQE